MSINVPTVTIERPGGSTPYPYELGPTEAFEPETVTGTFDGSGAAGSFKPTLSLYAQNGALLGRWPTSETIAAGGSAEVSWFRRLTRIGAGGPCCPDPVLETGIAAILIGSGSGSGHTLTIPVDVPVCYAGDVHVFAAAYSDDTVNFGGPRVFAVTDSKGHAWSDPNPASLSPFAMIGTVDEGGGSSGFPGLGAGASSIGSVPAGAPLCAGDTITVEFEPAFPDAHIVATVGLAVLFVGVSDQAQGQTIFGGSREYGNGDSFPSNGFDQNLSWVRDYGGTLTPNPTARSALIALAAAYPAAGPYSPLEGALVAEIDNVLSLAVSVQLVVEGGTDIDPGGGWGGIADVTVGNYQFAQL